MSDEPVDPVTSDPTRSRVESDPHARQAELELTPGARLGGRFRIVSRLGAGGMGEVYRADDLRLGQPVALKFLPRRGGPARVEHLVAEVRVGRELAHPNVCKLYDIEELDGAVFIVMEYIDGEDLASLLRRIGRLPPAKAVGVARDLCAGLAAIHERGIVHRDLKPGNVMIDGAGRARITDFGLARRPAAADGTVSGTPAYMAPEQLVGAPASVASDLFALGLVLYETFTGGRLFSGGSLHEIAQQHRARAPLSLADAAPGIEPDVERAILQCLEPDPAARPASARAVLAALPGGDPLSAAVAAGETPSPEMVAAATESGVLQAGRAWALLLGVLVALPAIVGLHDATMLYRRAAPPLPPAELARKATEIVRAVSPERDAAFSAWWLEENRDWLEHVAAERPLRSRWGDLAGSPHAFRFVFRSSPFPMAATRQGGESRITDGDPPFTARGMVRIVLDARGRLRQLVCIPPGRASAVPEAPPDPAELLGFAGLGAASLSTVLPEQTVPTDNDRKRAWTGVDPADSSPLRVEAAWLGEIPVWFSVLSPWEAGAQDGLQPWDLPGAGARSSPSVAIQRVAIGVNVAFLIVIPIGAYLLALRNLRRGRVDRGGTVKLAVSCFVLVAASRLVRADHVASFVGEWLLLSFLFVESAFWSLSVAVFYVAVEPYVRRRWPRALISWTRLLGGRFADPLIGRDLLMGFLAGALVLLAWHASALAPQWLGLPPPPPLQEAVTPLAGARHVVYFLLRNAAEAVFRGFGLLALLVVLRGVLRSQRAAVVVAFAPLVVSFLADVTGELPFRLAYALAAASIGIFVLLRYGLLSLSAAAYLILTLRRLPLSFDPADWYFGRSTFTLGLIALLAAWAFHRTLGGRPLFGRPLFED